MICFKVINLRMWASLRVDIKLQHLNLTSLFSLIAPKDGPFILFTGNRNNNRGNKRIQKIQGEEENEMVKSISMTEEILALI